MDLETSPLAVPWVASIAGQVVAEGPARAGFQWVNGAPRAGRQALLAVPLGERETDEVRLAFQGPGPRLVIAEVFLYGPGEAALPRAGEASARDAFDSARAGRWDEAVRLYAQAVRLEPERASHHAGLGARPLARGAAPLPRRREPDRRRPGAGRGALARPSSRRLGRAAAA